MKASDGNFSKVFLSLNTLYYCVIILRTRREGYVSSLPLRYSLHTIYIPLGLDWTGHMSFLTGQDQTPKFAGQVLPDRTESGLIFLNI